jgi:hypothetical protein
MQYGEKSEREQRWGKGGAYRAKNVVAEVRKLCRDKIKREHKEKEWAQPGSGSRLKTEQRKWRESRKEGSLGGVERECRQRWECEMKGKRFKAETRDGSFVISF